MAIAKQGSRTLKATWQSAYDNLTNADTTATTTIYTKTPRWSYLKGVTIPVT